MTPLGMWKPLLDLLRSTSSEEIRKNVLWILGTAVQNNAKAQEDVRSFDLSVNILMTFILSS